MKQVAESGQEMLESVRVGATSMAAKESKQKKNCEMGVKSLDLKHMTKMLKSKGDDDDDDVIAK